ncbi:MAG: outer membrane protein transport protein [Planctomycetales bacterium]|nr:outer membrane protein transport protein [Planctomycetales bacterium]
MKRVLLAVVVFLANWGSSAEGQGIVLSAAGPVNRSMGGASVAAPIDSIGAIYWNPASISGMAQSEVAFGVDLLWANHSVSSTAGPASGTTEGSAGSVPVPNLGWVHRIDDSILTLGLGVNAVAGFKTNLQVDPTNPILAPPPIGLGRISSEAQFVQIAPVVSLAVTDQLSIAAGPTITTGQLTLEPFVLDSANPSGLYSSGRASRYHWGFGAQAGVYYVHNEDLRLGASLKSPTWMETFEYYGQDDAGAPRTLHADVDLPLILSVGTSYQGIDDWLFAADLRFFDYANTDGFGTANTFDGTRLNGLGWSSIFAAAFGAQRTVSESIDVRCGYTFNQNPVSEGRSFFATPAPLIYQHMVSAGATFQPHDDLSINLAYSFYPETTRTGEIFLPSGPLAGTSVTNSLSVHMLSIGVTLRH